HTSPHWDRGRADVAAAGASVTGPDTITSVIADPRIENAVEDVGDQIEQHDEYREYERKRLHHRYVVGVDRRDQQLSKPVHLENLLGDDGAAEDGWHAQCDHRDDRDERVAQHVDQDNSLIRKPPGAGSAHIVLVQIVEHRGAHEPADLRRVEQSKHRDRHHHLSHLLEEAVEVVHDQRGVVDRGEPAELDRKDDDHQHAGEERRDRKADHRNERADLVEQRVLPVGRDHADRHRDQHADYIRHADDPQCLRQALGDDVGDRRAGLPGDDALGAAGNVPARHAGDDVQRLADEKLFQPQQVADVNRLAQSEREPDLLPYLRRNSEGYLRGRIARREIEQQEYGETDEEKRRDRQQQPPNDVSQHMPEASSPTGGAPRRTGTRPFVSLLHAIPVGGIPEFAVPGVEDNTTQRVGMSRDATAIDQRNDDVAFLG